MSVVRLVLICAMTLGLGSTTELPFHMFNAKSSLVAFVRPDNPSRYVGYRIVEGDPTVTGAPVKSYDEMPERGAAYPPPPSPGPDQLFPESAIPRGEHTAIWKALYEGGYQDKKFHFRFGKDGTAHFRYSDDEHGARVSVFKAVDDGIDAWMWLEPKREIPGGFLVQQCLRYSGAGNTGKRHESAFVPELSEYDLWDRGEMRSLSYVRQGNAWKRIDPVSRFVEQSKVKAALQYVMENPSQAVFYTPPGAFLAEARGGAAEERLRIPNGLIVRESSDGKTISGMYWERTAQVSVHHPADCLHSFIDLGPASGNRPRVVRGKIYWFRGTKEDLFEHWKRDFPG